MKIVDPIVQIILTTLVSIGLLVVSTLGGWFIKSIFDSIKDLNLKDDAIARQLNELAVMLPSQYVHKDQHSRELSDIMATLRRIEDKLDAKADR